MRFLRTKQLSWVNSHLIDYPAPSNISYFWSFGTAISLLVDLYIDLILNQINLEQFIYCFVSSSIWICLNKELLCIFFNSEVHLSNAFLKYIINFYYSKKIEKCEVSFKTSDFNFIFTYIQAWTLLTISTLVKMLISTKIKCSRKKIIEHV